MVAAAGGDAAAGVFALLRRVLDADRRTRVVFTSRELLPAPFADPAAVWELGALDRDDAVALVTQVLTREGAAPPVSDAGATAEEVTALVEAVGCHARALVLLARETARAGVAATTRDLQQLMARLEQAHPGDRENSLYASVALSLRRLPPDLRGHVGVLAACHGGIQLGVLAELTGLDLDGVREVAGAVIGVGLGEDLGDGCLGLDPGLAPYLRGELDPTTLDGLRARWADATTALTDFLVPAAVPGCGVGGPGHPAAAARAAGVAGLGRRPPAPRAGRAARHPDRGPGTELGAAAGVGPRRPHPHRGRGPVGRLEPRPLPGRLRGDRPAARAGTVARRPGRRPTAAGPGSRPAGRTPSPKRPTTWP